MERTSSAVVGSLSVTEPVTGGVRFVHAALLASVNGPWLTTFQNGRIVGEQVEEVLQRRRHLATAP